MRCPSGATFLEQVFLFLSSPKPANKAAAAGLSSLLVQHLLITKADDLLPKHEPLHTSNRLSTNLGVMPVRKMFSIRTQQEKGGVGSGRIHLCKVVRFITIRLASVPNFFSKISSTNIQWYSHPFAAKCTVSYPATSITTHLRFIFEIHPKWASS